MASIWKIGSVDVYIDGYDTDGDVKLAKLTPLDATSSSELHFFGSGSEEVGLAGHVFTESNKSSLETLRDNGTSFTLTSDQGNEGTFKFTSLKLDRVNAVKVSLAGVSEDATVYRLRASIVGA